MEYAKQGDRSFMELRLDMAKGNALEVDGAMLAYGRRSLEVRKHLRNEKSFHLHELETNLERAMEYAKEGDKCFMELRLDMAKKSAVEAGKIHNYKKRSLEIRKHLRSEIDFHLCELERNLERAVEYAKEGNRSFMELRLNMAKGNAIATNAIDTYASRSLEIRKSLKNEKEFHLREIDSNLERAMQYAKKGDVCFMKLRLDAAHELAKSAGYRDIGKKHAEIQSIFCEKNKNLDAHQNPEISSKETDIIVEKELNVEQVISKRIEEAASKGEVITIS